MKHVIYKGGYWMLALLGICFLSACSIKESDEMGRFTVRTMPMSTGLLYEVFPQNDDFKYVVMVLREDRCAKLSDNEVKSLVLDSLENLINTLNAGILEYGTDPSDLFSLQDFLYHGYLYGMEYPLEMATDYVICLFAMDDNLLPVGTVERVAATTKSCCTSDLEFDVHSHGRTICIIPSDNDVYFYDIERKVDVMDQYYGMLDMMFWENIIMLERYGMMDVMLKQGKDSVNVFDLLSPQTGDTMYMAVGGYDDFFLSSQTEYYRFVCVSQDSMAVTKQEEAVIYGAMAEKDRLNQKKKPKNLRMSKKSSTFASGFVR